MGWNLAMQYGNQALVTASKSKQAASGLADEYSQCSNFM